MIRILPQNVVNQIAAGEVVERPASVVKELIENSIDAGATEIKVYIREFGTEKIQVIDNGSGILGSDIERVFLKHATSKIAKTEDLDAIHTFGFRGEALASISSVSRVILRTKHIGDEVGSEVLYEHGTIQSIRPSAITQGTDLQILDLFANVPARKKFLKAKNTENKAILDVFHKFALANPDITLQIDIDGTTKSYPKDNLQSRVAKILKVDEDQLVPVFYDGSVKMGGFVLHPKIFLKSRSTQFTFVNKRPISDTTIYKAIVDGYDTFLMKNQIPGYVVFIDLQPEMVDVNVHPRKTEVRFVAPSDVYKAIRTGVNVNLVKFLREETQRKLQQYRASESNNTHEKYPEIREPFSNEYVQDSSVDETVNDKAEAFAEFLHAKKESSDSKDKKNDNPTDLLIPHGSESKPTVTQALLFNKEMVQNEVEGDRNIYLDFSKATQLLDSYIVTTNGKDILVIDQHAASERYFYEKYLTQLKSKSVESKILLFPEIIQLNDLETKIIEEHRDIFLEFGFDFEAFGDDVIKFTKVPDFVKLDDFTKVIHRIITDVLEHGELSNVLDNIMHEIAAILACHTAVRFGDPLTKEEIIQLIKNLSSCEDPYNCPHGRPIIQEYSKYDIEKKFKRCGL